MRTPGAILFLVLVASPVLAAPDSYCPPHQALIRNIAEYADEMKRTSATDAEKAKYTKTFDTVVEILIMGLPNDVESFCRGLINRELLKAAIERAKK